MSHDRHDRHDPDEFIDEFGRRVKKVNVRINAPEPVVTKWEGRINVPEPVVTKWEGRINVGHDPDTREHPIYPIQRILGFLDGAEDELAGVSGMLTGIATGNSAAALGMTVEQFMDSDGDAGQAGSHNPIDKLADAVYDELVAHINRALECAAELAVYLEGEIKDEISDE
jgi:hypothetical protein